MKNTTIKNEAAFRHRICSRAGLPLAALAITSLMFCSCQHGAMRGMPFAKIGNNAAPNSPAPNSSAPILPAPIVEIATAEGGQSGFDDPQSGSSQRVSFSDQIESTTLQPKAAVQQSQPAPTTFSMSDHTGPNETRRTDLDTETTSIKLVSYQEEIATPFDDTVGNEIVLPQAEVHEEGSVEVPMEVPAPAPKLIPHSMYPQELVSNYASMDEYLCDGGDRNQRVAIGEDFSITGLDLEDTVAHFDTLDGQRVVQPSNSVRIYSPRFGAVRQTYGVALSRSNQLIARADKGVGVLPYNDKVGANTTVQQAQPISGIAAEPAISFIDRARSNSFDSIDVARGFHNEYSTHEDFQIIRFARMDQAQKARLAKDIMKAEFWTDNQAAQVVVDAVIISTTQSSQRLQDVTGTEERIAKRKMRIIKTASKGAAKPGDLIEFTIRFDNLSNERIGNVTVVDNLTPRLEYVPDSQSCSIDADFLVTPNEGESLLLRWEVKEPMEPETGGVIRFKCLVR